MAGPDKDCDKTGAFELASGKQASATYVFKLYVAGTAPASTRALANVRRACEEHLKGCYELEVIDLYQQPALAKREQIIATPTLIKKRPLPLRRIIGDMSDVERILG